VASGERSPPLDLAASPGSTAASIAVVAADGSSRREYTLRVARENVPPPPDADAATVAGVGAFLEALVAASPLGATTDEEVRFALRFAGMDPLHLADASFRRELETLVRDYVAYAAVEPALEVTATAAAAPRAGGACRRRVAGADDAFAAAGRGRLRGGLVQRRVLQRDGASVGVGRRRGVERRARLRVRRVPTRVRPDRLARRRGRRRRRRDEKNARRPRGVRAAPLRVRRRAPRRTA